MRFTYLLPLLAKLATLSLGAGRWLAQEPMRPFGAVGKRTFEQSKIWTFEGNPTVQDAIDLADSYVQWVFTQSYGPSESTPDHGETVLVAVIWIPTRKEFMASSVPRGSRLGDMYLMKDMAKSAPWREAAPYSMMQGRSMMALLHAEDNIELNYFYLRDVTDTQFPDVSFTVSFIDHGPDHRVWGWINKQEVFAPCAGWKNKRQGCVETARKLKIIPWSTDTDPQTRLKLPQPLPQAPPPAPMDDNKPDDDMYGSDFDESDIVKQCGASTNQQRDLSETRLSHVEHEIMPGTLVSTRNADRPSLPPRAAPTTSTLSDVSNGATMVEVDGFFYWSATFTVPSACPSEVFPTFPAATAASSTGTSQSTTSANNTTTASSSTLTADPPCTFSADPDMGDSGACVCTNDATIAISSSNGQPCPWPTLPVEALAAQAGATTAGGDAIAVRTAAAGSSLPTTLVTETSSAHGVQ